MKRSWRGVCVGTICEFDDGGFFFSVLSLCPVFACVLPLLFKSMNVRDCA